MSEICHQVAGTVLPLSLCEASSPLHRASSSSVGRSVACSVAVVISVFFTPSLGTRSGREAKGRQTCSFVEFCCRSTQRVRPSQSNQSFASLPSDLKGPNIGDEAIQMHLSSAFCLPLRLIWGIAPRILRCALFSPPSSHRTKEERRLSRSRLTAVTQSVRPLHLYRLSTDGLRPTPRKPTSGAREFFFNAAAG